MIDALSSDRLVGYVPVLLPLLIAISGWLTLRLAFWAAVHPQRFVGIPPYLGWQGLLFSRLEHYVSLWSQGLLEKLGALDQIFERVGPEKIIAHQLHRLRPQVDSFIDEVMTTHNQVLWENLPILVKNRMYARAHRMLPRIIDDIVEDLGDSLRRLVSFPHLLYAAERQQPGTLLQLYRLLCDRIFARLIRLCVIAGFIGGLLQLAAGALLDFHQPVYWIVSGAGIGVCFFWLAQRLLNFPAAPRKFGPIIWRNPLNRSRHDQDRELTDFLARTVLSPRNLAFALLQGERAHHTRAIFKKRTAPLVEEFNVRTFTQLAVGPIGYVNLKQTLADKLAEFFLTPFEDDYFNRDRARVLAEFLHGRIARLPDQLFYQLMKRTLEPLAIIGTVTGMLLGAIAGGLQWTLLFF